MPEHAPETPQEYDEMCPYAGHLKAENAALRRDLAAVSGYARELEDRVAAEVERCAMLRVEGG